MNTKLIMAASAVLLALIGLSLTFLPNEILKYTGNNASKPLQLLMQLLGALYFAFAMLNWMVKGSVIGGIYNRPTAIANFTHFLIGSLALVKALLKEPTLPYAIWALALAYAVFAALFWLVVSRHPTNKQKKTGYLIDVENS